jgi:tetratricopeptide (TPR) repeat protein
MERLGANRGGKSGRLVLISDRKMGGPMANIEEARRLYDKGLDDYRAGEYEEAIDTLLRAREMFAAAGDRKAEGDALNDLGVVYVQLEEWDEAQQTFDEVLTIRSAVLDRSGQGITLGNMAMMYERMDDEEKAIEVYEQALEIFQALGEKGNEKAVDRQLKKLKRGSLLQTLGGMLGFLSDDSEEDEEEGDIIDVTPEE